MILFILPVTLVVSGIIRTRKPGVGGKLVLYGLKAYTEGSYLYVEGRELYQGRESIR